jgi:hypothetical protein
MQRKEKIRATDMGADHFRILIGSGDGVKLWPMTVCVVARLSPAGRRLGQYTAQEAFLSEP